MSRKRAREEEEEEETTTTAGAATEGDSVAKKQRLEGAARNYQHITLPEEWFCEDQSCVYTHFAPAGSKPNKESDKLVGFDYDGCIFRTAGFVFADKGPASFPGSFVHPNIGSILVALHAEGYRVVIFSNESIERFKKPKVIEEKLLLKISRCKALFDYCGIPMQCYLACKNDEYRKPASGKGGKGKKKEGGLKMWSLMEKLSEAEGYAKLDKSKCHFVGDAAGRKQDHSDADLQFATQLGIAFHDETCFANFPIKLTLAPIAKSASASTAEAAQEESGPFVELTSSEYSSSKIPKMLVLAGLPGSGKSTLGEKILNALGSEKCTRISQDVLVKKDIVEKAVVAALNEKDDKLIIVDRTNVDEDQRATWVKLAKKFKVPVEAVVLRKPASVCIERCVQRPTHESLKNPVMGEAKRGDIAKIVQIQNKKWKDPTLDEGFTRISILNSDTQTDDWEKQFLELFTSAATSTTSTSST